MLCSSVRQWSRDQACPVRLNAFFISFFSICRVVSTLPPLLWLKLRVSLLGYGSYLPPPFLQLLGQMKTNFMGSWMRLFNGPPRETCIWDQAIDRFHHQAQWKANTFCRAQGTWKTCYTFSTGRRRRPDEATLCTVVGSLPSPGSLWNQLARCSDVHLPKPRHLPASIETPPF